MFLQCFNCFLLCYLNSRSFVENVTTHFFSLFIYLFIFLLFFLYSFCASEDLHFCFLLGVSDKNQWPLIVTAPSLAFVCSNSPKWIPSKTYPSKQKLYLVKSSICVHRKCPEISIAWGHWSPKLLISEEHQ